ncbi:MAG: HEAT repeat domain-containing protein [Planctomycetales bacterium]|nr:HEAT repeat domain-containing protein [Planctomycetales bacterium]
MRYCRRGLLTASLALASLATGESIASAQPVTTDSSTPAVLDEESERQLLEWIELLGSPQFDRREQAVKALVAAGEPALPLLERNARHPNLEVRLRIIEVLSEVRQQNVERRLKQLIEGTVDPATLDLPMWEAWVEATGNSEDSRVLYAEAARAEWNLLEYATEAEQNDINKRVAETLSTYQRGTTISVATFTALLFLGADVETVDLNVLNGVYNVRRQDVVTRAIERGRYSTSLISLMDRLVLRSPRTYITLSLQMAMDLNLPSARELSDQILAHPEEEPERAVQTAIIALMKRGSKDDIPTLEKLFEDRRALRISVNNLVRETQMRDIALAASLVLAGGDLAEYKIETIPQTDPRNWPLTVYVLFPDGETRDAAFERWRNERTMLVPSLGE